MITENQLDEWVRGNSRDAQALIVELVWRLVAASCPKPTERRFPLGDSIGQHGPDGILNSAVPFEPFVPEGRSFWEIGTGLRAGDKATSDYQDLVDGVPDEVRRNSTFVFVTPLSSRRDWEHTWKEEAQGAWLDTRRSRNEWKDVRVIDGTKLVDWFRQFLSVELWLAERVGGHRVEHIETAEQRWALVKSIGEPPPLIPDVFVTNRDEARAKLMELFEDRTVQVRLETRFPDQVVDFVAACIADLDSENRADIAGRCLVVTSADAWSGITTLRERHILVADSTLDLSGSVGTKLIQSARRGGHAVVFGAPPGGIPDPASVRLHGPRVQQLQEALQKAGYREERARTLAQRSDGNLGSLLRCLQNLSLLPEWAQSTQAADLAIVQMLGAWSDALESDRAVVEGLSGNSYGGWIARIREVALSANTPLVQQDREWKFIARYEGWYALGPRLYDEHLERFQRAAINVLQERDPQFELAPDERYAAQIHGKVLTHSGVLRTGMAETLALLGSQSKALTSCSLGKAEVTATLVVRAILSDSDWVRWASVGDLLPLLAEAAPAEFLKAVEKALSTNPCPFDRLFAQEDGGAMGRTYTSGLLWALETLAWDPEQLSRVTMCLGELAARDPGGRWMNRPANSLTQIFLPWLPQTCAPVGRRVSAVDTLLKEVPRVGWTLVISLLPESNSISHGSRKPAWRDTISDDWSKDVSKQDYWAEVEQYAAIAIAAAAGNESKLVDLVRRLGHLPPKAHEQLLTYLGSPRAMALSEEGRFVLWNELVALVNKHRKFSDAAWAMNSTYVEQIASIADRLAPDPPMFRHRRLFTEQESSLYERKGEYEQQHQELENRREAALREIAAVGGPRTVTDFARVVQSPWRVGTTYGVVGEQQADAEFLPALLESAEKPLSQFAGGFVSGRFRRSGWKWVDALDTSRWSPAHIGQFLAFLPFGSQTWERSARWLGSDESAYWTRTNANPYEADEALNAAVEKLIDHGRPAAALQCLHRLLDDRKTLDSKLVIRALLAALESAESARSIDGYGVAEIIKSLQENELANADDVATVEWAYLTILNEHNDASPKLLGRRLASSPQFFCEVIRLVFRSKHDASNGAPDSTAKEKDIAANAYRLLREWREPPGRQNDGGYDGAELVQWLDAVKGECSRTGHLEIAMTMVGHVLFYAPPDPDGLWIHRSVAAALNDKDAEDMRDGFRAQIFNSRGVHWVDPTGKPEKDLAAKYRADAESVEADGFHRLATTVRELASTYERDAERISSRRSASD